LTLETAKEKEGIMDDPEPQVHLRELADNYISLQAWFWIANPRRTGFVRIKSGYIQGVKERFDEARISLPAPQRELSGGIELNRTGETSEWKEARSNSC